MSSQEQPKYVSRKDFKNYKKILIKVGTSIVMHSHGVVALSRVGYIVEQITKLVNNGVQVILVSSGSVGIGKKKLDKLKNISKDMDTNSKDIMMRSYAATGQGNLMGIYDYMFSYYDVTCSQVLLTDGDFQIRERRKNLRQTLLTLLDHGVVPILNENDVISLRRMPIRDDHGDILWDNDSLACLVGAELNMDLVVLLSDIDGLYKKPPSNDDNSDDNSNLEVIHNYIPSIHGNGNGFEIGNKSRVGRGGIKAKVDNALMAIKRGVKSVVIANGKRKDSIDKIIAGNIIGTLFVKYPEKQQSFLTKKIVKQAKIESRKLVELTTEERKRILINISNDLEKYRKDIFDENKIDLENAKKNNISKVLLSRLKITDKKLNTLIDGIKKIANYDEPIGKIVREHELSTSLNLKEITTPIGLLMIIFESRPDALPQICALAIKSGNGLLLKGGSEAKNSNKILHKIITDSIVNTTEGRISSKIIGLIESRENIKSLLKLSKNDIDLIIPRGGNKLVEYIQNNTKIPVLGHKEGICHVFIDEFAQLNKAIKIVIDSKINYPSACNSVETILIHKNFRFLNEIIKSLQKNGVNIFVSKQLKNEYKNDFINYPENNNFT